MELQNSYIFLKKSDKNDQDSKEYFDPSKNKISSYILSTFPCTKIERKNSDFFEKEYLCSISIEKNSFQVKFLIKQIPEATYLDINIMGKSKFQIVKCLEQVQENLLSSGIQNDYIDIVSYDAISEYYCNKILPKLNCLERNLRKLLFNIYIVNFGREYNQATVPQVLQNKIKGVIRAKGKEEEKEIERLQKFFTHSIFMIFKVSYSPQTG